MLRQADHGMLWVMVTLLLCGCAREEWHTYRATPARTAHQEHAGDLSDPDKVAHLAVGWTWQPASGEAANLRASPIIFDHKVFIGSANGFFYAINAHTGAQLWRFPVASTPLVGSCAFGGYGIQSSASRAQIGGQNAVLFGAPDPTVAGGLGSAVIYALNAATGALIWKSDIVAHVTGCTGCSGSCSAAALTELHERIAYSGPLVHERMVYVGVHDSGDDPIQNGKVVAIDLATGHSVSGFSFAATSTRGGGVWNAPATDGHGVFFTTGNTRNWNGGGQPAPAINNGLSAVRVNAKTGAIDWTFQAVPFNLDDDPDWSAGAAVVRGEGFCRTQIVSVQKDGWSYGLDAETGKCKWQYPPTNEPSCQFPPGGIHDHGDTDYKQPGAVWGRVVIMKVGGWGLTTPGGSDAGYSNLHALNACADDKHRVRWILQVPDTFTGPGSGYTIGAPTVTGGIVYVTTSTGHLIAIADTKVRPATGHQCTDEFINPTSSGPGWKAVCSAQGYQVVPRPRVLADVALPDGANAANLRSEPALADGKVYVGTAGGHVYALWPQ
jgi:outer membrane protein assembly factor BamB